MDLAVAQERCVFQAGDEAQDALLVAELDVVLEADEVVAVGTQILLAKLNDGVWRDLGAGIAQAHGLHAAEAEGIAAAACNLFNGQAAFEVVEFLPLLGFDFVRGDERVVEGVVLLLSEGAVDVVCGTLVPTRFEVNAIHVDGAGVDDGCDGVVEGELVCAGESLQFCRECRRGERAGGEDGQRVFAVFIERGDFFADDGDARLGGDAFGDAAGELHAIDGEGVTSGDGAGVSFLQQGRCGEAHLLLEQPGRGVFAFAFEGVGADEFREVAGLVRFGRAVGAHLMEGDFAAETCGLQGGFRAGEASADNFDLFQFLSYAIFRRASWIAAEMTSSGTP